MTDEPPAWVGIFREDLASMETRLTSRLDSMVSKDLFEAEQRNHREQHRLMGERLKEEAAARHALGAEMDQIETQRKQSWSRMVKTFWASISGVVLAGAAIVTAVEQIIHH